MEPEESWKILLGRAVGLCGCGTGNDFELLYEVLEWCSSEDERYESKDGMYIDVAHELAAKVLDAADLVEHGSGIGWPWATAEGKELLAKIRELRASEKSTTTIETKGNA